MSPKINLMSSRCFVTFFFVIYISGDTDDSNDSDGDGSDPLQSTTGDPTATTE